MTHRGPGDGLTAVDLFSGAGGASVGITEAGFNLLLAADVDAQCAATHQANLPGRFVCDDIRAVDADSLMTTAGVERGELDLLFAGPPCQGFSMMGQRVVWDERNNLFAEVLRVAGAVRPRAVVIENVPGLLTLGGGAYLRAILTGLAQAGYVAAVAELLAAQYGAPQMRWRVVVVAWRADVAAQWGLAAGHGYPRPTHGRSGIGALVPNATISAEDLAGFLTTRDAIADLPPIAAGESADTYSGRPVNAYQVQMRAGLTNELYDHYAARLSPQNLARIRLLAPGQDWRDLPRDLLPPGMQRALRKDHTRRYRRMTWEGVPRSVITRFRDPKTGEYTHPEQDRTLSIREAARLQGLPDRFRLLGDRTSQYEQVGNAVPVQLARAVAEEVARCLQGEPGPRIQEPFRRRPVSALGRHGELVTDSQLMMDGVFVSNGDVVDVPSVLGSGILTQ